MTYNLFQIFALAMAVAYASELGYKGYNDYGYNSGYSNGYDLGNSYDNYGSYNLGYNNNYGYQQRTIHKRSPKFRIGFPIKFLPIIG